MSGNNEFVVFGDKAYRESVTALPKDKSSDTGEGVTLLEEGDTSSFEDDFDGDFDADFEDFSVDLESIKPRQVDQSNMDISVALAGLPKGVGVTSKGSLEDEATNNDSNEDLETNEEDFVEGLLEELETFEGESLVGEDAESDFDGDFEDFSVDLESIKPRQVDQSNMDISIALAGLPKGLVPQGVEVRGVVSHEPSETKSLETLEDANQPTPIEDVEDDYYADLEYDGLEDWDYDDYEEEPVNSEDASNDASQDTQTNEISEENNSDALGEESKLEELTYKAEDSYFNDPKYRSDNIIRDYEEDNKYHYPLLYLSGESIEMYKVQALQGMLDKSATTEEGIIYYNVYIELPTGVVAAGRLVSGALKTLLNNRTFDSLEKRVYFDENTKFEGDMLYALCQISSSALN
jgi:hypothetical protein